MRPDELGLFSGSPVHAKLGRATDASSLKRLFFCSGFRDRFWLQCRSAFCHSLACWSAGSNL